MRSLALVVLALAACGPDTSTLSQPDMRVPDLSMPQPMECANGFTDGQETDQDCGGPTCTPCDTGKSCKMGRDCLSTFCTNSICDAPSCMDGVKNGTESDQDCGGSCAGCAVGKKCNVGSDCMSMTCTNGTCAASPCSNGKQDGAETDVDCGGGTCEACVDGRMCQQGTDCKSAMCTNNVCKSPVMCMAGTADCDGNAGNGCEVNTDTDANNCGGCANACAMNMTCAKGVCSKMTMMAWTDMDTNGCTGMAWNTMLQIANAIPAGPTTITISAHQAMPVANYGEWSATFPNTTCVQKWLSVWGKKDVISFANMPVCGASDLGGTMHLFWLTPVNSAPLAQISDMSGSFTKLDFADQIFTSCDLFGVNHRMGFNVNPTNASKWGTAGDTITFTW